MSAGNIAVNIIQGSAEPQRNNTNYLRVMKMEQDIQNPETEILSQCPSFRTCNAPLCPLDPNLKERIWYADEDVCKSRKFGNHRWIRKQRSIQKYQTKSWLGKPTTQKKLYEASRPPNLSAEDRKARSERMKKIRREALKGGENPNGIK